MKQKQNRLSVIALASILAAGSLIGIPVTAVAVTIQFDIATQILSSSASQNTLTSTSTAPYATLTFSDTGPQQVQLVIASSLETAGESFNNILFNGSFSNNAHVDWAIASTTGTFTSPGLPTEGNNALNLSPPNNFDYRVSFALAGDSSARFDGTDSITYTITCAVLATCGAAGSNPLDATDFNAVNAGNADATHNGLYAVAGLTFFNTGTGANVDVDGARYADATAADNVLAVNGTVPEPSSLVLLGLGLSSLALATRRKKQIGEQSSSAPMAEGISE